MEWKAGAICHPLVIQKRGRERPEGGPSLEHDREHAAMGTTETAAAGGSSGTKTLPVWSWRRVNRAQQTPLNQFHKVKKCPCWVITHRKTLGKESLGAEVHHWHKHCRREPTGMKWPEAHREWHSWAPTSFKKNQLLQSSGGKANKHGGLEDLLQITSISV